MAELKYELEFITPAFIGGAEPSFAELRPASVVGMLRWWWRALNWSEETKKLFNKESEIFGNQERAGALWVRVKGIVSEPLRECKRWDVHRHGGRDEGKVYMGFGNIQYIDFAKEDKYKPKFPYMYEICDINRFKKGSFTVRGFLSPGIQKAKLEFRFPEKLRKDIEALLYIVSRLGSLGGRSRRGWGSFYLKPTTNGSSYKFWTEWNKDELVRAINTFTEKDIKDLGIEIYEIKCLWDDPMEVIEQVGRVYKEFRNRRPPDYKNVKALLEGKKCAKDKLTQEGVKRSYFGLPIQFRFNSLGGKSATVEVPNGRQASPVRFRVIRKGGKYTCLIIHVKNLPITDKVVIKPQNQESFSLASPEDNIFYDFIEYVEKKMGIAWRSNDA